MRQALLFMALAVLTVAGSSGCYWTHGNLAHHGCAKGHCGNCVNCLADGKSGRRHHDHCSCCGWARPAGRHYGRCAGCGTRYGVQPHVLAPFGHHGRHAAVPSTPPFAGPHGPPTGTYAYPYYTIRSPRDFLVDNPPSIGY